jgi:hypothetical protein
MYDRNDIYLYVYEQGNHNHIIGPVGEMDDKYKQAVID